MSSSAIAQPRPKRKRFAILENTSTTHTNVSDQPVPLSENILKETFSSSSVANNESEEGTQDDDDEVNRKELVGSSAFKEEKTVIPKAMFRSFFPERYRHAAEDYYEQLQTDLAKRLNSVERIFQEFQQTKTGNVVLSSEEELQQTSSEWITALQDIESSLQAQSQKLQKDIDSAQHKLIKFERELESLQVVNNISEDDLKSDKLQKLLSLLEKQLHNQRENEDINHSHATDSQLSPVAADRKIVS